MKKIVAFASAMLAFGPQAYAADLAEPAPAPEVVEPLPTGGWYLRKDISYDFMSTDGVNYRAGNDRNAKFNDVELDDTWNMGVGVGYQFNDYFRVDKTFDYLFSSDFRGSTKGGNANDGSACDVKCKSTDVASFQAFSVMANAYVDIYHWGVFTPYVGAGLGATYVDWGKLKNTACATDGSGCDNVSHKGKDSWRFTYGLMVGTSIDINCQWKADVGYRYRNVDGGPMFGRKFNGGPGHDDGIDIHEVRSGIRYSFGDSCQTAYLPPAELPAEQPVFK